MSQEELTPEEQKLLDGALFNLQRFIKESTRLYEVLDDPRNEDDYDTFEYGTEPLPGDETWSKSKESDTSG